MNTKYNNLIPLMLLLIIGGVIMYHLSYELEINKRRMLYIQDIHQPERRLLIAAPSYHNYEMGDTIQFAISSVYYRNYLRTQTERIELHNLEQDTITLMDGERMEVIYYSKGKILGKNVFQ